jgi:hypothetical protein
LAYGLYDIIYLVPSIDAGGLPVSCIVYVDIKIYHPQALVLYLMRVDAAKEIADRTSTCPALALALATRQAQYPAVAASGTRGNQVESGATGRFTPGSCMTQYIDISRV